MKAHWIIALAMLATSAPTLAIAEALTLERVFANPPLAGAAPRAPAISPDGRMVTVLKSRADDQLRSDLWVTDVATGEQKMLVDSLKLSPAPAALSEAELQRRERARIAGARGITDYRWAPDSRRLLVPLDGDIWLASLDGTAQRLTRSAESETDAKVSPRGGFVSYVRGANLYVHDLTAERAITTEGAGPVSYGSAEFVAQEEMKRNTGYWWSPDDRRIAVARVDETPVRIATRAAIGAAGTAVTQQRYPFAGTPNALVTLEIRGVSGGAPVKVDLGPDPDIYLARVDWLDAATLVVQRQSRDQKRLDLLAVDATTGAARLLFSETSRTFLNLHDGLRPLATPGHFLWLSERDGFQHLYRWNGKRLIPITRGPWVVDEVEAVDEAAGLAFVSGFFDTVLEKSLYAVRLDGKGSPRRLTQPGGWAESVMDKAGTVALVTRSTPDQPPQVALVDRNGQHRLWVTENAVASTPYAPFLAAHRTPVFGTLPAADGQAMHYMLLTPPNMTPGTRHPVFFEVYAGPGVQRVSRQWGRSTPLHQWLAQQGWVVFMLDNRGTTNRGVAFESPLYRQIGTLEVTDQLAALDWLKAQPFVDPTKVALYGWSYGGYMTLRLLTQAPTAFAAGVSGAPVTDWTLYDTHYTERYLGNPGTDMAPYSASNVVKDAARISRPLLLIHGLADDNVVFDNSARMMAAMQASGIRFDTMVYPGQTHAIRDPALATHMWRGIMDFLDRTVKNRP
ncbi:S9 family peptidase [Sandaracinobacteroides saxicola]|uniref:DPP IV N-terminal domain-containing protein n=1 Tax=Sandaracinobacteroides saxicola TaxID=2759707 RepID=A0A7G5IJZ0_9SPHN|nr:S9 family peptidase [Sandaracinobacteroides saxicola]QMW23682.1 DPP IV N-terminal domain-containing protein [Sandaracinobacteroides saxicola]